MHRARQTVPRVRRPQFVVELALPLRVVGVAAFVAPQRAGGERDVAGRRSAPRLIEVEDGDGVIREADVVELEVAVDGHAPLRGRVERIECLVEPGESLGQFGRLGVAGVWSDVGGIRRRSVRVEASESGSRALRRASRRRALRLEPPR
jgi:hypothetical protein